MFKKLQIIFCFLFLGCLQTAKAIEYKINPTHSNINFMVAHFGKGQVKGQFRLFSGSLDYEPNNLKNAKTEAQIDSSSIYTGISLRDGRLRSPQFLNTQKHPQITFVSTEIQPKNQNEFIILGNLTINGVTRLVKLNSKLIKTSADQKSVLFKANTSLKRKDFGLVWNDLVEAGNLMGDDIKVYLEIEGKTD